MMHSVMKTGAGRAFGATDRVGPTVAYANNLLDIAGLHW